MVKKNTGTYNPQRGTTLVELLVVMAVFSLLITAILGFYVQAQKVTNQQNAYSETYRKAAAILNRIEVLLTYAKVHKISEHEIIYSPLNSQLPFSAKGPNWASFSNTIALVSNPRALIFVENGKQSTMSQLEAWQYVYFSGSPSLVTATFEMDMKKHPNNQKVNFKEDLKLRLTRTIIMENYEKY